MSNELMASVQEMFENMNVVAFNNKMNFFLIDLVQAAVALVFLLICMFIGAKILRIDIYGAIDKVENNPVAYAIFVVGHFFAAAYLLGNIFAV